MIHSGFVYTERERDRERERGFSSWISLVICKKPFKCEREREQFFVRANDRLDCPQSEFVKSSRGFFTINQSESISLALILQIETCKFDCS